MNKDLFEKSYEMLNEILATITKYIGLKEFDFRSKKLKRVYEKMLKEEKIDDEYYAIAHEIRAIDMFINMGQTNVAKDCQNEPGVDLQYKDNLVECVICTAGNEKSKEILKENGYQVYNIIIDYHAKFKQITLRVLSSLRSKGNKYHYDVRKGVLDSEKPFCIFLNLGGLSQEWFPGKYCNEATRFLVGRGNPIIKYDLNTLEQVEGVSYTYSPFINNNNNAEVITNFFGDRENASVSA